MIILCHTSPRQIFSSIITQCFTLHESPNPDLPKPAEHHHQILSMCAQQHHDLDNHYHRTIPYHPSIPNSSSSEHRHHTFHGALHPNQYLAHSFTFPSQTNNQTPPNHQHRNRNPDNSTQPRDITKKLTQKTKNPLLTTRPSPPPQKHPAPPPVPATAPSQPQH